MTIGKIFAARGATTVSRDCEEEITVRTRELIAALAEANGLGTGGAYAVSCIISTTDDIHSFYPAKAYRESGLLDAPVFSCKEPDIDGALPLCIRVLLEIAAEDENASARHLYLHGAKALRPDLTGVSDENRN